MGKFDQLLRTLGFQPKKAKPKHLILLRKSLPVEKPEKLRPKDLAELRRELDEAVIAGKISGTDARDICHQLATGKQVPDDLAIRYLAAVGSNH
ncbi:hypothetical protein [Methylobacterium soli]|uniref:Uncharacterized protein n=1 Tax=Methylobacterium soli TaxID=553447 RepID=A0A6L3SUZ0_9HYPH|nr:hypothetical protein [Methylobacterium soli]KAB1075943.1 hypothetical protein F6X53_24245 [Methylobacterium soli]GJE46133.1 hypothetical protein AEGHOMDF_5333 [Methylobacterium soli]